MERSDDANFINFCAGETLTNGQQVQGGSCNGIVMGKIPATNRMISSIIQNPQPGQTIQENETFDIVVNTQNLAAGSFTNPQETYYSAPQDLDGQGRIIGHTHVTVQDLGNDLTPNNPPDAQQFVFFKGINDAGNGQGILSATVTGGLPAGNYRVCTMTGASNHQPVLMPVAQRGAQDDCTKFTVGNANAGNNNNNNNGGNNNNNNGGNNNNNNGGNNNGGNNNNSGSNGQNAGNGGNANGQQNNGNNQNAGQGGQGGDQATGGANNNGGNNRGGFGGGFRGNGNNGNNANNGSNANGGNAADNTDGNNADAGNTGNAGNAGNNGNDGNANNGNQGGGSGGASAASALGGIAAPAVEEGGNKDRPFSVNGNTFVNKAAAVQRACDVQNNQCANAVNGGQLQGVNVGDCGAQVAKCVAELS